MRKIQHLIRSSILALLVIIGFTLIRNLMVPKSFGEYGHYRADAVAEEMANEPVYQGVDVCRICHLPEYDHWKKGKHQGIDCESCHGSGKKHVVSRDKKSININRTKTLCLRCHIKIPARPHNFPDILLPRIDAGKHLKGKEHQQCFKCHTPHYPDVKKPETEKVKEPVVEMKSEIVESCGQIAVAVEKKGEIKPAEKKVPAKETSMGRSIYEKMCLGCHGQTGDGQTKIIECFGVKIEDFSSASYTANLSQIIKITRNGKGITMPAYEDKLSEQEIEEVARYIQGL